LKLKYDKLLSSFAFNFNLRRYIEDATMSVGWKPPASCVLKKNCDNAAAPYLCQNISQAAMPWFDVKRGNFPALTCSGGAAAKVGR
jgi:hypothetical protein